MKIPYAAVLILSMILSATSAFGRELEELKPGAEVQSKAKPGTTYRVQEVTPRGIWVTIPRQGGIKGALGGEESPSGTKRIFIARDEVEGVEPLAPLGAEDLSGEDRYARLREVLQDDASAADRAGDLDAAALLGPLREREALLRKLRKETKDPDLRALLDEHFNLNAPMRGFVRRALVEQLWEQGQKDALGATEKAWNLTLDALSSGAKEDLEALRGVRGALQRKVVDDLAAGIERDPARTQRRAAALRKRFAEAVEGKRDLPEDMSRFLADLQGASHASPPSAGPLGQVPPPYVPEPRPMTLPAPELPALPLPLPEAPPPAPEAPKGESSDAEVVASISATFEEALSEEPENLQAQLLEAEAKILGQQPAEDAALNPALNRVRSMLRDANRRLQRIAGEALESDPVAFTARLLERGAAYERALRNLPRNLRESYRSALGQISNLLKRARQAARAQPLTPLEGAKQIRELRIKRAEAIAQGLNGLAKQLQLQEAEVQRRIK